MAIWTEDELVKALELLVSEPVIGIDGLQLAGKSRIADRLGARLGWQVLHCDDFICYGTKPYPDILDIPALKLAVHAECPTPKLLDGILLATVLEAIEIPLTPCVYVRRRNTDGTYFAPDYYENFDSESMFAVAKELYLLVGALENEPMLECELINYHQRFDPVKRALLVFENVVSS